MRQQFFKNLLFRHYYSINNRYHAVVSNDICLDNLGVVNRYVIMELALERVVIDEGLSHLGSR